jgi:2-amino-4-hydroxy-6-hydroxymethyldihydropteridine diphosphokinase
VAHIAYIALGANLGDRDASIRAAGELLRQTPGVSSVILSSLYETEPVGGPAGQPTYLNAAARVETDLGARELMDVLLNTEAALGRQRIDKWGPRTIDLDLLLFDDAVINTPDLTVPHPRMHERRFVLHPLVEIAPDVVHPVLKQSVLELLRKVSGHSSSNKRP